MPEDPSVDAHYWPVDEYLQYICESPNYRQYFKQDKFLEIIVRGDGMPVGGKKSCFLLVTLGNFEEKSKCLGFNFPVNLAEVDDKNREAVRIAFHHNIKLLNTMAKQQYVILPNGTQVACSVHWGGDEAWLRMLLGLLSAKELLACLRCLWQRMDASLPRATSRTLESFRFLAQRQHRDHAAVPIIDALNLSFVHTDAMHALPPFGKDICGYVRKLLAADTEKLDLAQEWLRQHSINVTITYPSLPIEIFLVTSTIKEPKYGKWSIKATDTWEWILHWDEFCALVGWNDLIVNELIDDLIKVLIFCLARVNF